MKMWKVLLPVTALLMFAGPADAQTEEQQQRPAEAREIEYAERLRQAEARMAEAARQVAELTSERLPPMAQIERRIEMYSDKPRIGITIDGDDQSGAVEGVEVMAVTPGSAAEDAGLRSGDILTSINDEMLTADSSMDANKILFEFMDGVEEGDVLDIEYLRNGNQGSVELKPRQTDMKAFAWAPGGGNIHIERIPGLAGLPEKFEGFRMEYGFPWAGSGMGSMELVELNEGLGKYFGTDKGLLVVNVPESDSFGLEDGDVIQSIDGREPRDVRHAMRILSSYQSGEKLELGIMRDKKKRKLDVEIPEKDHRGTLWQVPVAPIPAGAPSPPRPPRAESST